MASQFLLILLAYSCFSTLAYTAAPPVNIALDQPLGTLVPLRPENASIPQNVTTHNGDVTFKIPGTQISLTFSRYSRLISQTELDLCIVEGLGTLFGNAIAKGKDGNFPLNSVEYKYGNLVINIYDFSPPSFRMTFASVVTTLRGIAFFTSIYGYYGMAFEVFDERKGHVGTGEFGVIIPDRKGTRSE